MAKSKHDVKDETPKTKPITGTYVYDAKLGRVVKVSDRIPKVASHGPKGLPCGENESGDGLPCGQSECGGGACGMGGFDD